MTSAPSPLVNHRDALKTFAENIAIGRLDVLARVQVEVAADLTAIVIPEMRELIQTILASYVEAMSGNRYTVRAADESVVKAGATGFGMVRCHQDTPAGPVREMAPDMVPLILTPYGLIIGTNQPDDDPHQRAAALHYQAQAEQDLRKFRKQLQDFLLGQADDPSLRDEIQGAIAAAPGNLLSFRQIAVFCRRAHSSIRVMARLMYDN